MAWRRINATARYNQVIPPMLLANAALAGPEARFRYPLDPLIAVALFGGLVWLAQFNCVLAWFQRYRCLPCWLRALWLQ